MCTGVAGLPVAGGKLPLWQVPHCAETDALAWKRAGVHDAKPALWQVSQLALPTLATVW